MSPPLTLAHLQNLDSANHEAQAGDAMAARGQLQAACCHYEKAIRSQPDNAWLYWKLGTCQWRLGFVQAGASFQKAVQVNPRFAIGHAALSSWALQYGLIPLAEQASRQAMELAPDDSSVLQTRAAALEVLGELDNAWHLVELLVNRGFVSVPLVRLYGRMACYRGQQQQAYQLVEKQLHQTNRSAMDRSILHFTAAELLDSLGRYDEAFHHGQHGNHLVRSAYDPNAHERTFESFINYFTRKHLAALPRARDRSEKPVFIVGMPRSGTSLVEQILATHPAVHGAGELDLMAQVWTGTLEILSASPEQYPACLNQLSIEKVDQLAQMYLQPLIALNPLAKRLTDKLPLNFLHLGLISLLLPGARIIDCRREPRDTCLSCYLTLFQSGNDFKFDLNHTAHFYCQTLRLMGHWREVLDVPILEVSYEALVTEPESQTRRLLDFVGLPWDPKCLRFHETKRAVTSSSIQQVRQPLYHSSIGRWRNYERHLMDLNRWFPITEPASVSPSARPSQPRPPSSLA